MNRTSQKRGFNALKVGSIWLFLLLLMAALSLVAVSVGSAGYSLGEILRAVFSGEESTIKVIIFNLRLPRLLLALLIGASLSASGALLQSVMRNPLADPGTIGVSAGAGTAATTILLLFPHLTNSVPIFAFGGAALACALIYMLAWKGGVDPVRIILSGVAINSVLSAYNSLLQLLNSDSLEGVLAFMNGSLSGRSWQQVKVLAVYAGIGLVLSFACIKSANTLQLGDEMAKSLGVIQFKPRLPFGGIGLSGGGDGIRGGHDRLRRAGGAAHIAHTRRLGLQGHAAHQRAVGRGYTARRRYGGRTMCPGMEIPVGIVMAVTGGPFFLYMLRKKGSVRGN